MSIYHQFERDGFVLHASRLPKSGNMPGVSLFSLYHKAGRRVSTVALCKPASVIRRIVRGGAA
jgi:hypothetical protein